MARGGKPRVYIDGDASGVTRATRQAEASLKRLDRAGSRSLGGLSKTAKGLNPHLAGAIAGFTSLAGAAALLKDSVKTTEDLAKGTAMISRTTGESTQEASRWVAVAKVRGLEVTRLNRSFVGLAKAIEGANAGSKKQAALFKDLGVSQKELAKGDVSQILGDISDAFAKMPDGAKKAATAQALFGRGAATILPMLNKGNAALREQLGLSDKYGTTLTKGQLAASLKAAAAQREMNLAMMGLKVQLGQAVIPALTVGITKVTAFVAQMRSGEGAGGKFAAKLKDIWSGAKPVVEQLGKIVTSVGKFVAAHPGLTKVVGAMVALGLAVKAISFASQITGIGKLVGLFAKLGGVGTRGGASLADGILSGFSPKWAARKGTITSAIRSTGAAAGTAAGEAASGNLASRMGKTIGGKLKSIAAPAFAAAGTALGAALAAAAFAKILDEIGNWTFHVVGGRDVPNEARSPNSPQPDDPTGVKGALKAFGIDVGRKGGFMRGGKFSRYRGGGTVPALVSSGEVIVEPGGSAWRAPGAPVAADNVPAMLKPGSAVLTWDGQARMMAGQSLASAVANQAPHFRSGGYATWTKVGASVYGGTPGDDNGVGSVGSNLWRKGAYPFAELGWGHSLGGLKDYAKLYIRRGNRAVVGTNEDVGPSYGDRQIDLHKQIAVALGISPTSFLGPVQIMNAPSSAKPGPVDPRTLTSTGSTSGGTPARTVTRTSYAAPSPGTGRSSRSAFDAGFESGMSDPFGLVRSQDRSDYYNSTKRGLFGTWTTTRTAVPGTAAPSRRRGATTSGGGVVSDARAILASGNTRFPLRLETGGTARRDFESIVRHGDGQAWVPHTGRWTPVKRSLMDALAAMAGSGGTWINALTGGNHSNGSHHYSGTAVDLDLGSPLGAGRIQSIARRYGGQRNYESSHIHLDFRRGGVVKGSGGHSQLLPTVSKVAGGFSGDTTPTRNAAYSTLWRLIGLGYGRQDEPAVRSTYARELSLIDRLGYDDLRYFSQDVKGIYRRQFGSTPRARTIRARLTGVLGRIDAAIGRSIGRPIGVADSVEADISDQGGQLADKLTLGGVDPDSKEGIDATIDFNNRSITRLWRRRAALKDALARAKRLRSRPDVAKQITDEIKDVDSQVTAMAAANVRLRRSRISAPTNAEAQAGATGGGGDNPDLQAQLDQANVRATVAQRTAGLNEAFIRTAFGSGDIGRGGSYAWTAAGGSGAAFQPGMSITINTLHPGDSQTLAAIADAATAGMGQQGFVTSPRAVSGV